MDENIDEKTEQFYKDKLTIGKHTEDLRIRISRLEKINHDILEAGIKYLRKNDIDLGDKESLIQEFEDFLKSK